MKMIWRTPKHHNRRKHWIIRWLFFFTAKAQNIVYWTYVKLKCTKVVNIFTDGLPCIPNATHSGSVAGDRARATAATLLLLAVLKNTHGFCRACFAWQLMKDVPKPWVVPGDTLLYSCEQSPWALAASQSSVRSWSHAPPVFKKLSWRQ